MALPLIPFVAGAALGSFFTFASKDQVIRDHIVQGARGFMGGAQNLYQQGADGVGLVYRKAKEGAVIVYDKAAEGAVIVYEQSADVTVAAYEKAKAARKL